MPARSVPDEVLVSRCRTGDQEAWSELVDRFGRYVWAIAFRGYRLSRPDAEDVFQEVFSRTYEHLAELRNDAAIRAWIGQVTRHCSLNRLRTEPGKELGLEPFPPEHGQVSVDDEQEVSADEQLLAELREAQSVHEALARLGDPCQDILNRFFLQNQPYRIIGEALDIPVGTVSSRISRCLDKLRVELDGTSPAR